MPAPDSTLSDLLAREEREILDEWLRLQLASGGRRSGAAEDPELRRESAEFLGLLRAAAVQDGDGDTGTPPWQPVREFLEDLSASRAERGFSASETAGFIFSLKEPLFARLPAVVGQTTARLAAEAWRTTTLLDRLGLFAAESFQRRREEIIRRQQRELMELSTPVVQVWKGIVALPLIGTLDSERTQHVTEALLTRIVETDSTIAIIDITGVPTVDTLVAQHLLKTVAAARLMGTECIISGIRPQIAQTVVHLGIDLSAVVTRATLADAIAHAFARLGLRVSKPGPAA